MTRKEAERRQRQAETLQRLGFTDAEAEALRRISMTLQRWYELECGLEHGAIVRDDATGRPYWESSYTSGNTGRAPMADREAGAVKRLQKIISDRNKRRLPALLADSRLWRCDDGTYDIVDADGDVYIQNVPAAAAPLAYYLQTDPRGAALYIIRPGDVPAGEDVSAYYSRGICVY